MGTNIVTHSNPLCRVRDLGIVSHKYVSIKSFPEEIREPCRKWCGKSVKASGVGGHQKYKDLKINKVNLHVNSQRHKALCTWPFQICTTWNPRAERRSWGSLQSWSQQRTRFHVYWFCYALSQVKPKQYNLHHSQAPVPPSCMRVKQEDAHIPTNVPAKYSQRGSY